MGGNAGVSVSVVWAGGCGVAWGTCYAAFGVRDAHAHAYLTIHPIMAVDRFPHLG